MNNPEMAEQAGEKLVFDSPNPVQQHPLER